MFIQHVLHLTLRNKGVKQLMRLHVYEQGSLVTHVAPTRSEQLHLVTKMLKVLYDRLPMSYTMCNSVRSSSEIAQLPENLNRNVRKNVQHCTRMQLILTCVCLTC